MKNGKRIGLIHTDGKHIWYREAVGLGQVGLLIGPVYTSEDEMVQDIRRREHTP